MIARMKPAALLLLLAVGCSNPVGDDEYPITPPGGGGGNGNGGGGGGGSGSDGGQVVLKAKVCILTDSTRLDVCAPMVDPGLQVKLRGTTDSDPVLTPQDKTGIVTTAMIPAGGVRYWVVTGETVFKSLVQYDGVASKSSVGQVLPVFLEGDYKGLTIANGVQYSMDEGAIIERLVRSSDGANVAGALATLTPTDGLRVTQYATVNPDTWEPDSVTGTTTAGLVWYPGLPGDDIVDLTANRAADPVLQGQRLQQKVTADYVTFVTIPMQ